MNECPATNILGLDIRFVWKRKNQPEATLNRNHPQELILHPHFIFPPQTGRKNRIGRNRASGQARPLSSRPDMSTNDTSDIAAEQYISPLPPPPLVAFDPSLRVPDDEQCAEYWTRFSMLENVAEHSQKVAMIATFLAARARKMGLNVDVPTVRASALLHDIAKTYCIRHGGNHSQLGGAWAMELTGNPVISSGVTHHVHWPFELDLTKYFTPLAVIYADKRVNHTELVSIRQRFEDLVIRYGIPLGLRDKIKATEDQALALEKLLCDTLEVDLNECDFDSGRLV